MDFSKHFSAVTDPHDRRKIDPLLTDIFGLAIIGCICGCVGFEDIEEFGEAKQEGVINDLRFIDSVQRRTQCCRVIRIISHRTISDTTTTETCYYISSRQQPAAFFQNAIRSHWGIENRLHWVPDILFDEDHCSKRKDNAAENLSIVRKIALNIIRSYQGDKISLKRRRLKAGWDTDYFTLLFKS